jgi:ABC-2 type transport system ATP-binding protein
MLALECQQVSKVFYEKDEEAPRSWRRLWRLPTRRVDAVKPVSFHVHAGEIYGILGQNGSGKSTLIRMIATLLIPDSGSIKVFGHDVVTERAQVRRLINRVSVDAAFFKKLSAWENLAYAARLYGLTLGEANQRSQEIMARLGFPAKKMRTPLENLSRGQQQKVAIARALMTAPRLLLLDEPTTGLDPRSKRDVQDFILEVQQAHNTTVILTSHDMAEAERLCQRVAFIHEGEFRAEGTCDEVKQKHAPTGNLEDVFFALTGKTWNSDAEEEAADD